MAVLFLLFIFLFKMEEVEIPTIACSENESKVVDVAEQRLQPVSIATLFLRFSSKKELMCLIFGFICKPHSFH